jgi:CBS domain-containing protein
VADLMTRQVTTCAPKDTIEQLMWLMTDKRIRHLPVVGEDGGLAGIVSIGDVVKHRLGQLESENQALFEYITQGR